MKIFQVDAFTDKIFSGNPAGVCLLTSPKDEVWMQNMAMEINLSETAFLQKYKEGFKLRWFTPQNEVDLCGHATLASAHILWQIGMLKQDSEARFYTKSGKLTAKKNQEWIELNFPIEEDVEIRAPKEIKEGLNLIPNYVGKNRMDYIVEVESEEVLKNINPDLELLKKVKTRGIIVTSVSSSDEYDFVSRFFAPRIGINEDPVTGSAHCCLGPFWKRKLNKNVFKAYQASQRGGILKIRVGNDRIYLSGQAKTVFCREMSD